MFQHYLPDGLATPYLISEWVIPITMLFFVPSRRTPQAAQAWLLLIFFLPLPGLILYVAIGRPRFPAWRTERLHRLAPFFRGVCESLGEAGAVPGPNAGASLALNRGGIDARKALPFRLLHRRTRNDMRNHRKLAVIDGRIGYAGSQNIVSKAFRPGVINRELVARLTGPIVAEMDAVIVGDWYLETEAMLEPASVPPPNGDALLQLLPSGADYPLEGFETLLVWQLHKAERRVVVVTPYLVPD